MASEATPLGSVEVQTTGENLNTWGEILNATITRLTEMAVGALELTITGNVALDNEKYVANESRSACLSFIGSGLTAAPVITLPAEARQNVINEAYRVTKPGGVFVICDSVQAMDSPEFEPLMENFPAMFHEPYYRNYIGDDLVARLENAGFQEVETYNYFMSKYWVAKKSV